MNKILIAILSFFLLFTISCSRDDASYTIEDRIISTYPFSDPSHIPILTKDKRLYPYHAFMGYSSESEKQSWQVIKMENDYIEVFMLPEVGGKVWGAIDKSNGEEFIYRNEVMKFRNIALRGPWTSGGIEFNFGIIGHTPATATKVDYLVRKNNDLYEIVAGERRWRAAQIANIHEVPVVIKELTNEEVVKISIIENIQRVDLNPIEEANSYNQLIKDFGYTQEKVATSLGKSRSYITNSLRLLSLPQSIIKHVQKGKLSSGHARALVGAANSEFLARKIIEENLSVRDIENIVKKGMAQSDYRIKKTSAKKDVDTINLEQDIKAALGLKTTIDHNENSGGGCIIVKYKDLEQLDMFCSKIMKM